MPGKERGADNQPKTDYTKIDKAVEAFTFTLLEQTTRHTEVWRRGGFRIPTEKIPALHSALSQFPFRRLTPQPGSKIPLLGDPRLSKQKPIIVPDFPEAMSVGVEAFDHRPKNDWHEELLSIALFYKGDDPNFEDYDNRATVLLELPLGRHVLNRRVSMMRYAETGYEGHGFDTVQLSPDDLSRFLQLAVENLGDLIPEKPFMDFYKRIIMVSTDTGKRFIYDEERGTHVSEDGITMEEYRSPFEDLRDQLSDLDDEESPLRTTNIFHMEIAE